MDDAALEKALLLAVSHGDVESDAFASANGADHKKVVGLIKSLESSELVASTAKDHSALKLSPEAEAYLTAGSPEAQAFAAVPSGAGIPLADFKKLDKTISDIGFKQAMQQKWLAMEKGETPMVVRKADSVEDVAKGFLAVPFEYIRDATPGRGFNLIIRIHEIQIQPFGHATTDGALARAHHSDEDNWFNWYRI